MLSDKSDVLATALGTRVLADLCDTLQTDVRAETADNCDADRIVASDRADGENRLQLQHHHDRLQGTGYDTSESRNTQ